MTIDERDQIAMIPKIGPAVSSSLEKLGIRSVGDLLRWYPREYLDGSHPYALHDVPYGRLVAIEVEVDKVTVRPTKSRGLSMLEAVCFDDTGSILVRWFNQPFLKTKLQPGTKWTLLGTVERFNKDVTMLSPIIEIVPRILAIYGQTQGVTSKMLRGYVDSALRNTEISPDSIPESVRQAEGLITRKEALKAIHQPATLDEKEVAHRYLAFEEAFTFFVRIMKGAQQAGSESAPRVSYDVSFLQEMVAHLPFELTAGQKRVIWDGLKDMSTGRPMTRLLNGDVGSGKTVVAAMLAATVAKVGLQSVILVPTDILAKQHHASISAMLAKYEITVMSWTASLKEGLENADIIIGTHAVLQEGFALPRLGLVIIDEQHRFGVKQRQFLRLAHGGVPHVLSMTATPIPRTLALALYGDLQVSLLKEKPKDRLPIITELAMPGKTARMEARIVEELALKKQILVICPLIEETKNPNEDRAYTGVQLELLSPDELAAKQQKTVVKEAERLRREHPEYGAIEIMHGKLKAEQKREIMAQMAAGEINVLVATSVIEVGVDLPNATVIVIEGAERFGLAQLHQFRGRVGRGKDQSYCFLAPSIPSPAVLQRLRVLVEEQSGFAVAEHDLQLRGPGELAGSIQSGLPDFRMASLTDIDFLSRIKALVEAEVEKDPDFLASYSDEGYSVTQGGLE
jgi:ATP-dependent DNA helicase RecG